MEPSNSKPMPSGGGNVAAAFHAIPAGKGSHYRDYDFVPTRSGPLDYNESDPDTPHTHTKRKRDAAVDQGRQHSSKKPRKPKDDRSDRLCLHCGNYHSSPCYVPHCGSCDLNHYPNVPCLDAMEQLKRRLEFHSPSKTPLSSKQKDKKNIMAPASLPLRFRNENHVSSDLSDLQAPTSFLKSVSQSPINKRQRESPNKRSCPICRECGSFHRSACKWPVCEQCHNKHHPETPCAVAEARLKRRLEEEDARQARETEKIKKDEKSLIENNREMSSATLEFRRSSAPSPGRPFNPGVALRKLKKNTRFCRDCGRYLNGPCTWPTCKKCNKKHFEHIPCWQARQNLQDRLDTFDRGYGTSQKKKPAKAKALPPITEPPSQQIEHAIESNPADPAAPMDLATSSEMESKFDDNREMTQSLDSNKNIDLGPPRTDSDVSASPAPKSPEYHDHVHPSRQLFFSKHAEIIASTPETLVDTTPDESMPSSDSTHNEAPLLVTYGDSIGQNVDALIADVLQDMHDNDDVGNAPGHVDVPQGVPSYLDYLHRNGV